MQNGINGFHHVALKVRDFDAACRFYTEGLGLTEKICWGSGDQRGIMFDCGNGNVIEVFAGGNPPVEAHPLAHVALRTDDVDGMTKRAVAAGAEMTMEPQDLVIPSSPDATPVRISFCRAPTGEILEFMRCDAF